MVKIDFLFSRTPDIYFGVGKLKLLPGIISKKGRNILLVIGSASFRVSQHYNELNEEFSKLGLSVHSISVSGEPTPNFVDETTKKFKDEGIDVVVSIGGGSVMDAGKAISAMLLQHGSVTQYLEAKDNKQHNGVKIPFIAVPTTAGTGSEATKNAVLSVVGADGYKSSLRHDNFMPDVALIDPSLELTCPKSVTAACGLDTFSQLLEGYVSTAASPMTDALAISGLENFKAGYERVLLSGSTDIEARTYMAYASLMSGLVLANAGLGLVHGYAGVIGGYFNVPHGVVCGTLLAEANKATIDAMLAEKEKHQVALGKYAKVYTLLSGKHPSNVENDCKALIGLLEQLVNISGIQKLGHYNIQKSDIQRIIAKTSNKNNPIKLESEQIAAILEKRI